MKQNKLAQYDMKTGEGKSYVNPEQVNNEKKGLKSIIKSMFTVEEPITPEERAIKWMNHANEEFKD